MDKLDLEKKLHYLVGEYAESNNVHFKIKISSYWEGGNDNSTLNGEPVYMGANITIKEMTVRKNTIAVVSPHVDIFKSWVNKNKKENCVYIHVHDMLTSLHGLKFDSIEYTDLSSLVDKDVVTCAEQRTVWLKVDKKPPS